jgi:hypothetical protein
MLHGEDIFIFDLSGQEEIVKFLDHIFVNPLVVGLGLIIPPSHLVFLIGKGQMIKISQPISHWKWDPFLNLVFHLPKFIASSSHAQTVGYDSYFNPLFQKLKRKSIRLSPLFYYSSTAQG